MAPTWPVVTLCRVADHLPGALEPSETWPLHSHPVGHGSGVHLWNACVHACYESLPGGLQGAAGTSAPAPWWCQVEGAAGSVRVPPGPSRATGRAPACLGVCEGGSRWATWGSWRPSEGWPEHTAWLPAAPWLPDPAPLGCAQQIPSSWDLPAISLSEDGVLGRGVCRTRDTLRGRSVCSARPRVPGSALVSSWGLGRDSSPATLPNPAQPPPRYRSRCRRSLSQHRWTWAILGLPVPGCVPAPLCIPQTIPVPGRLETTPEFGVWWAWSILASVPCSCVALDKFLSPPGVRLPTCKVG